MKYYQSALDLIVQCQPILEILQEKNGSSSKMIESTANCTGSDARSKAEDTYGKKETNAEDKKQGEEEEKLVLLLEQRLQYLLRSLIKLCLGKSEPSVDKTSSRLPLKSENLVNLYKQCYGLTLKSGILVGPALIEHMSQVLKEIERKLKQNAESN